MTEEAEPRFVVPVTQAWTWVLPLMQQTVLLAAIRGPDGYAKDHPAKPLQRWLRRCVLLSAFDRRAILDPHTEGGGSFTGPCVGVEGLRFRALLREGSPLRTTWQAALGDIASAFIRSTDELPYHHVMHVKGAAEVLGYRHEDNPARVWWMLFYRRLCADMHVNPETREQMDYRLGDDREQWIAAGDAESSTERPAEGVPPEVGEEVLDGSGTRWRCVSVGQAGARPDEDFKSGE